MDRPREKERERERERPSIEKRTDPPRRRSIVTFNAYSISTRRIYRAATFIYPARPTLREFTTRHPPPLSLDGILYFSQRGFSEPVRSAGLCSLDKYYPRRIFHSMANAADLPATNRRRRTVAYFHLVT